jgi:cytochrome oxidase Cu insertion factor (SCO1/SenC/PrrC family)
MPDPRGNKGRRTLLLVTLVFAAPVIFGWGVYATRGRWNLGTINHGQIISPARPLGQWTLDALEGAPLRMAALRGKWTMVYIGSSACPAACRDDLYKMRQVRMALGEDSRRVKRLFILTDQDHIESLRTALAEHSGLQVAAASPKVLPEVLQEFASNGTDHAVYLVDPLGNLMMRYAQGYDPKGMLKDLQRLLDVSRIG